VRKLLTGEPHAGEPHVWFGGRGGLVLPDPYRGATNSKNQDIRFHFLSQNLQYIICIEIISEFCGNPTGLDPVPRDDETRLATAP